MSKKSITSDLAKVDRICRWFPRAELTQLIQAAKIEDGKTIMGFMLWRYGAKTPKNRS